MRVRYRLAITLPYVEDGPDSVVLEFEAHHEREARSKTVEILVAYPTWQHYRLQRMAWDHVEAAYKTTDGRVVVSR